MAYEVFDSCFLVPGIGQSACAAWVQAWGTIAAVVGAVWIGQRQAFAARKLEADKRHLDDLLKMEIVCELFAEAAHVAEQLGGASTQRSPQPPTYRHIERAGELEQAFRALPLFAMPGRGIALAALEAPKALLDLRLAAESCVNAWVLAANTPGTDIPSRSRVEFERARTHAKAIFAAADATCRAQIALLRERVLLPNASR